jgi:hypothetical protein
METNKCITSERNGFEQLYKENIRLYFIKNLEL